MTKTTLDSKGTIDPGARQSPDHSPIPAVDTKPANDCPPPAGSPCPPGEHVFDGAGCTACGLPVSECSGLSVAPPQEGQVPAGINAAVASPAAAALFIPPAVTGVAECLIEPKDHWLACKGDGVGSSSVAALYGLGWTTRLELWAHKTGRAPREDKNTSYIEAGNRLEPVVAQWFVDETKIPACRNYYLFSAKYWPHVRATPDYWINCPERGWGVLECKTTNAFNADDWRDGVPQHYYLQVQHQLVVTGLKWGAIACLVGGNEIKHHIIERDNELIADLLMRTTVFWHYVENKIEPPAGDLRDNAVLKRLYPQDNGQEVQLDVDEFGALDDEWRELEGQLKALKKEVKTKEKRKKEIEARIKQAIGDNKVGRLTWDVWYELPTYTRKAQPATTYRRLYRKETK